MIDYNGIVVSVSKVIQTPIYTYENVQNLLRVKFNLILWIIFENKFLLQIKNRLLGQRLEYTT